VLAQAFAHLGIVLQPLDLAVAELDGLGLQRMGVAETGDVDVADAAGGCAA